MTWGSEDHRTRQNQQISCCVGNESVLLILGLVVQLVGGGWVVFSVCSHPQDENRSFLLN